MSSCTWTHCCLIMQSALTLRHIHPPTYSFIEQIRSSFYTLSQLRWCDFFFYHQLLSFTLNMETRRFTVSPVQLVTSTLKSEYSPLLQSKALNAVTCSLLSLSSLHFTAPRSPAVVFAADSFPMLHCLTDKREREWDWQTQVEGGKEMRVEGQTGWRKMKEQDRDTLDQAEKGRQSVPFREEWVDGLWRRWAGGGGQKLHRSLIPNFITRFIHSSSSCELRSGYHHLNSLSLSGSGVSPLL